MAIVIKKKSAEGVEPKKEVTPQVAEPYRLLKGEDSQFFATVFNKHSPIKKEKVRVTMADGLKFIGTIFQFHSSLGIGVRLSSGKEYVNISCTDNLVEVIDMIVTEPPPQPSFKMPTPPEAA